MEVNSTHDQTIVFHCKYKVTGWFVYIVLLSYIISTVCLRYHEGLMLNIQEESNDGWSGAIGLFLQNELKKTTSKKVIGFYKLSPNGIWNSDNIYKLLWWSAELNLRLTWKGEVEVFLGYATNIITWPKGPKYAI